MFVQSKFVRIPFVSAEKWGKILYYISCSDCLLLTDVIYCSLFHARQHSINDLLLVESSTRILSHLIIRSKQEIGYCEGQDLYYWLTQSNSNDTIAKLYYSSRAHLEVVKQVFEQILEAVGHCHDNDIAHRDLKPENFIVITKNGKNGKNGIHVKLTDSLAWLPTRLSL